MAFVPLSYLFEVLTSVIEAVVGQILKVFMISSLIGSYVVYYVAAIAGFLLFAVETFCTLVNILSEDFMIFLCDVVAIISIIHEIISSLLTFAVGASIDILIDLRDVVFDILMSPILLYFKVLSVLENFGLFVVNAADLVKRSLTLIGTSIWLALMFIPYSLTNLAHLVAVSCVNLTFGTYDLIHALIIDNFYRLCDFGCKLFHYFVDVPCEACGGLAVGILLLWITYKERYLIKTFCSNLYQLHLNAVMMLIQSIKHPCQCLIHQIDLYRRHYLFWRRERTSQSVNVVNEISENGDDPIASTSQQGDHSNYMLSLKKKLEKELEEKMCSVCQERRKSVIVLPCRHLCMCDECVLIVERISRKCPLCRRHIAKTMAVYL